MNVKWLVAPVSLLAGLGWFRKIARLAGVSAVASVTVSLARTHTNAALLMSDQVVGAVLRVTDGPVVRTHATASREVTIALGAEPRARVDERFLSVAIDSSLLVGGHWWSPNAEVEPGIGRRRVAPFDFGSARLRELAHELAPAYLRLGGTEADRIYYAMEGETPPSPPAPYELMLTRGEWDQAVSFARDAGFDLFFTLNAGPSSRDVDGRWQPDNAKRLLRYASDRQDRIAVLELGNEINAYWLAYGPLHQPDGATIAADGARLRSLAHQYFPTALLAGPGEFVWPRVGSPFASQTHVLDGLLESGGASAFDVLTWHYYPQQSRRCPVATRRASPTELLDPAFLDEISRWAGDIEAKRSARAPGLALWLGETGNAQCGGEPMVSDRFVSSLWWTDQLGLMAARGQQVMVRQALIGSDYGLLDSSTLEPRPDYFASVLYKRLMGSIALDVIRDDAGDPFVRTYAHCAAPRAGHAPGSATLLAINLHPSQSAEVHWAASSASEADIYQVTAPDLTSSRALLNGQTMVVSPGLPVSLEPERAAFSGSLRLPPASYTFAVVEAALAACR
jgi:heparanase 1